ncbi:hypothetical protein ACF0H5_019179 [Mactra antiquata]
MEYDKDINDNILRIYICGPHSTGKTTLLNDLRPYLNNIKVAEELARGIIKAHGWSRDDFHPVKHPDIFKQLNEEILDAQVKVDDECTKLGEDFISDRAIDPIVYIGFYIDDRDKNSLYEHPGVKTWLLRLKQSLIFLIYPHQECLEDDNVRLTPTLAELIRFHDSFEKELQMHDIPYIKVTELDRQSRVTRVLDEIKLFKLRRG